MILSVFKVIFSRRQNTFELRQNQSDLNCSLVKKVFRLEVEKNPHLIIDIDEDEIKIQVRKKRFTFGMDDKYIVKGVIHCERAIFKYSLDQQGRTLKHYAICIMPTIIMLFIFSFYDFKYVLIPVCYYFSADFTLFLKNNIRNNRDKNNFEMLLRGVRNELKIY